MALHPDFLAIMGKPVEADMEIVQGDGGARLCTLRKRNTDGSFTPYDLSTYAFRLQVRADYQTATVLIAAAIAPTATLGQYSETWDPAQTAALAAAAVGVDQPMAPIGVYDLDVSSAGETVTLKRGRVTLKRQVSRT